MEEMRKKQIAAMSRKELNANVYLLEQEQEEYEHEKRRLLDEIERLQKENEQNLDIINRMSNEMDGIEEPFKYEIEQLQERLGRGI